MEKILKDLGCVQKEILVYLALIKLGNVGATNISTEVKLPRQTVYYSLESLIEKGLVEQTDLRGVKQFVADPFKIKSIIDDQKRILESNKKKLDIELIKMMSESHSAVELPKVQFYKGQEGLKRLLSSILDVYKRGKYKTFKGYAISQFYPGMEDFIDHFVKERHKLGVESKLFVPKDTNFTELGGGQGTFGREFKTLDIDYHKAGFYIVGKRIYLFSYKDGVGVLVENENLSNFFRDIFDNQWMNTR